MQSQETRKLRGRHAALHRYRGPDHPDTAEAARDLKAAKAAEYVTELVASPPSLTDEQLRSLAVLLEGGGRV